MARKGWDALSSSYRGRLERAGISEADYRAGASLGSARGHRSTPEHPERALDRPRDYRPYLERQPWFGGANVPEAAELGPDWYRYEFDDTDDAMDYVRSIRNPQYVRVYVDDAGRTFVTVQRPRSGRRRAA